MPAQLLTPLQVEATQLFFSLPQSVAVAGGAALIEQGLIQRQTRDVDLFLLDAAASTITSAAASFETAIGERGWSHQRVIDQRLRPPADHRQRREPHRRPRPRQPARRTGRCHRPGTDLERARPRRPQDLALFGRAEARDFTDLYDLARRFGRDQLLDWAAEDDPGFDNQIFADMLASIGRLSDEDLSVQARHALVLQP
jgi:hypothetical protein